MEKQGKKVKEHRSFVIETPEQLARLLQFIAARELPFQCEVGPVREQRSVSQNGRLWALHQMAAKETGYTPDELHEEMLARHFGYTEKVMPTGWTKRVPLKRSSARDKKEFRELMDFVEDFYAREFGIWLDKDAA